MQPDERFKKQPRLFWANVRCISEQAGYTHKKQVHVPSMDEICASLTDLGLTSKHLVDDNKNVTAFGKTIQAYFQYRAKILNEYVSPKLMDAKQAGELFEALRKKHSPKCAIPMNKQKGDKKKPAYLTAIVNILIEAGLGARPCVFDPRHLTAVTKNKMPLRTLSRRVDGAFPNAINPVAIWEIKEYYHTTTFGSRIADGVYETLLDGMELEELREHEGVLIEHLLIVDAKYTWWDCGRSYLCRIIDMLHMGYVDEVLFGREVVERLPAIVKKWVSKSQQKNT
jgi:hypothetical protein